MFVTLIAVCTYELLASLLSFSTYSSLAMQQVSADQDTKYLILNFQKTQKRYFSVMYIWTLSLSAKALPQGGNHKLQRLAKPGSLKFCIRSHAQFSTFARGSVNAEGLRWEPHSIFLQAGGTHSC